MTETSTDTVDQVGEDGPILVERKGAVTIVSLNRPKYANAQNDRMLYELDAALQAASNDDDVGAIVLRANGKHFSSGHDIGSPDRRDGVEQIERKTLWYGAEGKPGAERQFVREQEIYLGLCRRWQALPKPMVGAVQGACIAGGLMLAWVCDLIVASDDAYFSDPVVSMGAPGVEYFAHPFEMPTRIAREFLMLGAKFSASRAYEVGMINRVVERDRLDDAALEIAEELASKPRFAMTLTKQALNLVEDIGGKRSSMEAVFGLHHLSHAHNAAIHGTQIIYEKPPKK